MVNKCIFGTNDSHNKTKVTWFIVSFSFCFEEASLSVQKIRLNEHKSQVVNGGVGNKIQNFETLRTGVSSFFLNPDATDRTMRVDEFHPTYFRPFPSNKRLTTYSLDFCETATSIARVLLVLHHVPNIEQECRYFHHIEQRELRLGWRSHGLERTQDERPHAAAVVDLE